MLTVNKFSQILLDNFYIDSSGDVRRSHDGYLNRFKKHDLAKFFISNSDGYKHIQVPSKRATVKCSHLVLLLSGVIIPDDKEVDHIDGNKLNDHPSNLRVVDRKTNSCNRKKRLDNTSGITGIRWSEPHGHYVIRKTVNGMRISRSSKDISEAKKILQELQNMDHRYTSRHGK